MKESEFREQGQPFIHAHNICVANGFNYASTDVPVVSLDSSTCLDLKIFNRSGTPVTLLWLDWKGIPVFSGNINPGQCIR